MEVDKTRRTVPEIHETLEPHGQAILFGGHGSQFKGMGKEFYSRYPYAIRTFLEARRISEYDLTDICFNNTDDLLSQTRYAQPAIVAYNQVCLDTYLIGLGNRPNERYSNIEIGLTTGQSLGQLNAFYLAGFFGAFRTPEAFEKLIKFAKFRGEKMQERCDELDARGGSGLLVVEGRQDGEEQVQKLLELKQEILDEGEERGVYMALDINSRRYVIGGMREHLKQYQDRITHFRNLGIRSGMSRSSSGAFHTPLMKGVDEEIYEYLQGLELSRCSIPVLANTQNPATEITEVEEAIAENTRLMTNPVEGLAVAKFFERSNLALAINLGQNPLAIESVSGDPRFSPPEQLSIPTRGDPIVIGHLIRRNKN